MTAMTTEAAIWDRVLDPGAEGMTPEAARHLLRLDFPESDHDRMGQLAQRAQAGTLTPEERSEYEDYVRVSHLLALIQSKARVALRGAEPVGHG